MTAPLSTSSLPDFPLTTHSVMLPQRFEAPPANPSPNGLYAATAWQDDTASRFFDGVEVRGPNFGGHNAFGVWEGHYCSTPRPGQIKDGERPQILPLFDPITVWAFDECDLTAPSRVEVERRAAQILRVEEQVAVEQDFAYRMLTDAGTPHAAESLRLALGYIEGVLARTNTVGFIHVGAQWVATDPDLFGKSGTIRTTPGGHTWVIGGGYVDGLENTLLATSQPYGWRNDPSVYTAIDEKANTFAVVAERTVLVGYEALIAATTVTP